MEKAQTETTLPTKLNFPSRPSISKSFKGKEVKLMSNHFSLSLSKDRKFIYLYSFKLVDESDVDVPQDNRELIRNAFNSIKEEVKQMYGKNFHFAGMNLWSINDVQLNQTIPVKTGGKKYTALFTKVKEISLKPESFKDYENAAVVRQYINVLIKRFLRNNKFIEWGTNSKYYHADRRVNLQKSDIPVEVWSGYKTSCEVYQNLKLKVQIDFSSRILRTDSVLDFISQFKSRDEVLDNLVDRSVVADYGNFRMWRIHDVDFKNSPATLTFNDDNGHTFTIFEYFKKHYNITIKDKNQPLLVHIDRKSKKKFQLVPELMRMTGLTDEMRNDYKVMNEVAKHTRLNPADRLTEILDLTEPMAKELEKDYGIHMETKSEITGQLLPAPQIVTGKGEIIPDRGNFQIREQLFKPASFAKWMLVFSGSCKEDADMLVETLKKCSGAFGVKVGDPVRVSVPGKNANDLKDAIKAKYSKDTQIVVCLYPPPAKKPWYKALKEVCCKEIGVPCQAVVNTSLKKNAMSVCSKILIQMNVKVGLPPWIVKPPQNMPERVMVIGADVYHKFDKARRSCIGFCASLDPNFSKYYSKISFQKPGAELMEGLGKLVKEAVLKYFTANGKKYLPEYILFYRDGVSDGQLKEVLEFETASILKELGTINENYKPKFAEIIVTKRISDRFFNHDSAKGQYYNPYAGTLVANEVTSNFFDFFIVAQSVTQGSCTPTRYNVIYDSTGLPADVFYQFTFYQCYNYYNWYGGVRVPSTVMYAHKLAYLVGQTIKDEINQTLEETLYYM